MEVAVPILTVVVHFQRIKDNLDAVITRVKTTARGYSPDRRKKLQMQRALLDELVNFASKSGGKIGKTALNLLEDSKEKADALKKNVETDTSLQRFMRHGRIDKELKSLEDTVGSLCNLMHLQAQYSPVYNVAGESEYTVLLKQLEVENRAQKLLIEEMAESSRTPRAVTHQRSLKAGPWLEEDYKGMSTECRLQIKDILQNDTFQEVITTKEDFIFHMTSQGATVTSPITLPSITPCSHSVPQCIGAVLSFVKGCASSLSGAKGRKHNYEPLGRHLVQLITSVLPQAISECFDTQKLSVKERVQLFVTACQLREFPQSKYFKQEIKAACPLVAKNLESELSKDDDSRWKDMSRHAWESINDAAFSDMEWEVTFEEINWLPEHRPQRVQMDYLQPVTIYLRQLEETLRHPGLSNYLREIHNCFTSLMLQLDECIREMFSNDDVQNFNRHAVDAINKDLVDIQRFAEGVDQWLKSNGTDIHISSGLRDTWKWVDLLKRIEPQLFPDRISREAYYRAVMERYHPDLDSRKVVDVCEKFIHIDNAR